MNVKELMIEIELVANMLMEWTPAEGWKVGGGVARIQGLGLALGWFHGREVSICAEMTCFDSKFEHLIVAPKRAISAGMPGGATRLPLRDRCERSLSSGYGSRQAEIRRASTPVSQGDPAREPAYFLIQHLTQHAGTGFNVLKNQAPRTPISSSRRCPHRVRRRRGP